MRERLKNRIKRKIRDLKIEIVHFIIRKAVSKLDALQWGGFLAYTWDVNETVSYHVQKEMFLPDCHVIGTKTEYYSETGKGR